MGINMLAFLKGEGDLEEDLDDAFAEVGLDCDFRCCGVCRWRHVVEACLGWDSLWQHSWKTYDQDEVKAWLEDARRRKERVAGLGLDTDRFLRWLERCVELGASVIVW